MKMERLLWKLLFAIVLIANTFDLYNAATLPELLQPVHPWWLSLFLFPFSVFVLLAAFCAAFQKKYVLKEYFWWFVLVGDFITNVMVYYYEFSAGGYSQSQMIDFVIISLLVYLILIAPLLKCIEDIRKNDQVLSEN